MTPYDVCDSCKRADVTDEVMGRELCSSCADDVIVEQSADWAREDAALEVAS